MAGLNAGGDRRGVSQVVAVALLIAITVSLAVGAGAMLTGTSETLHEPASADVSVSEATFTASSECAGGSEPEVALDVTLSYLQRADTVYVLADGGTKQVVWSDPGPGDVGTTKRVANEAPGNGGVDVDIGGGGDVAICVGDEETFRFYAESDGETTLLETYTVD